MGIKLKENAVNPRFIWKEVRAFFRGPGMIRHFIAKAQEIESRGEAISIEGHSEALQMLAAELGKASGLPDEEMDILKDAVEMHDIGKLPIPDTILRKPEALTEEEYEFIKQHPKIGFLILYVLDQEKLAEVILFHHERWDGKGYPSGISGEDIPLLSRIISIVDAYDAMTCDRVYRKALRPEEAIRRILAGAGKQFDPDLAETFHGLWSKKYDALP